MTIVTTTVTGTISTQKGMATASVKIVDGEPMSIRLVLDIGGRGINQLLIENLEQLKDVGLAAQELLEAVARMTRRE